MDTESQDALRAFCEAYTLQHLEKWPTSEPELAQAFVSHFRIPIVSCVADLRNFLLQTNIELIEGDFPADLLGVNMSFGVKRQIFTSRNVDHQPFRIHTVLHEIREIIEADFRRLGLPTANSSDVDSRADEFSFVVYVRAAIPLMDNWLESALEATGLQKWASLFLLTVGVVVFGLASLFGAFGYRLQSPSLQRPRLNHI